MRKLLLTAWLAAISADQDEGVGWLGTTAGREAFGELAPRGDKLLTTTTTLGLTLTTTVGVIDRVHGHTTNARTATEPAIAASLAERFIAVFSVPDFTDRGTALRIDDADFAGRHLKLSSAVFNGYELETHTSRTSKLSAATRLKLNREDARRGGPNLERKHICRA